MGTIDDNTNRNLSGTVSFTVRKYGDLSFTTAECENAGNEFNPLEDPHNPTDPSAATTRGGIDDVTAAVNMDNNFMQTFTQKTFLQNLGGLNSIIGRSVEVFAESVS